MMASHGVGPDPLGRIDQVQRGGVPLRAEHVQGCLQVSDGKAALRPGPRRAAARTHRQWRAGRR
ncbi:hypothetical protein F751_3727 [Auxenochlorella protothecoides]|uniref:Uncharacterized protein n=1 Tax=Auxenochlorella protothecoides TaxID=3075 RepID=A0A087SG61_AUXPR|nr:hypothetical protein F751_3727 [Auxenochlorella protothecoides]KFM24715.1 hypothetical protein F751_3727 [Auxenochlorella protothecoides]